MRTGGRRSQSRRPVWKSNFRRPISGADNLTHWLISTQVPTWKSMVCLIQASFETPHLA